MAILTIEKLQDINASMLGLGAPVEIDGQGYNKVHWSLMMSLYNQKVLTDKQQKAMLRVMIQYSNTQLTSHASDLKETLEYLESVEPKKDVLKVKVESFDSESVSISWKFNKEISEFIKGSDRKNFRWSKPEDHWVLKLFWCAADEYIDKFIEMGYDTSDISSAKAKSEEVVLKDSDGNIIEFAYEAFVERPDDSIDTLTLKVNYHPVIADAIKSVPYVSYNQSRAEYTFRIEDSVKMYNALIKTGKNIDLTELEPWKKLVESWNKTYTMMDLSKAPLKFTPYPFQLDDIKRMLSEKVVLNANDMGCGKTFESVATGESMPMKKLVICPATLRLNWATEILMVNPDADIKILYNNSEFTTGKDWTIIGYPSVSVFQKELEKENFQCIFIDEAHYCQAINSSGTPDSQRAKAVLRLTATAGWVYPLTGTPKTNRNKNLFNILRMIRHDLAKGQWSFIDYGRTYCDGVKGAWGWDFEGNSNDDDLNEKLNTKMIRHLKKEVLPNLKKQRVIIPVQVDLSEYNMAIAEYLQNRQNKEAEQLARLMRARKILATQKVGETIDFAREFVKNGDKIIIVTCFTEVVRLVEKAFSGNIVKIVGGMNDAQKDAAKQEFQNGSTQVLVMNIVAGGVGLTLTASHNMIFNDYDWIPGNITQAEDRICRGGQTECCMIHYITAKGADVEEDFVDMLTYKSDTINQAVDGGSGETIDFRTLVEKSAGITRSDKIRKILSDSEVKSQENKNKTAEKKNTATVDYSNLSVEEIKRQIINLGGVPKSYENPAINRMRLVMQLKKLSL